MDDEIEAAIEAMADHVERHMIETKPLHYSSVVERLEALSLQWLMSSGGFGPDGPFVDVSGDWRYPYPLGVPSFPRLLGQMLTLHVERNNAYVAVGSDPLSNYIRAGESIGVPGWKAAFMRLSEKQNRLQNVLMNGIIDPESAEDNLLDIAVLALLTLDLWKHGR